MVKNPAVPRSAIAKQLKLLEKSLQLGKPSLYLAGIRSTTVRGDVSGSSESEMSENEAAAYIANSPLMRAEGPQQQAPPSSPVRQGGSVTVTAQYRSPSTLNSEENTRVEHIHERENLTAPAASDMSDEVVTIDVIEPKAAAAKRKIPPLSVWRPSDADLGYAALPSKSAADPVAENPPPGAAPSSNRYCKFGEELVLWRFLLCKQK
jgi:hypothetical protein